MPPETDLIDLRTPGWSDALQEEMGPDGEISEIDIDIITTPIDVRPNDREWRESRGFRPIEWYLTSEVNCVVMNDDFIHVIECDEKICDEKIIIPPKPKPKKLSRWELLDIN